MRLDKKGDVELNRILFIIGIIAAILFFGFLLFTKANEFAETDTSLKINIAQDIQMMVNTLVGVPGDAELKIPYNLTKFNLILRDGSITVFKDDDPQIKRKERKFFLPAGYSAIGTIKNQETVCIGKVSREDAEKPEEGIKKIILLKRC